MKSQRDNSPAPAHVNSDINEALDRFGNFQLDYKRDP